ncbi:MAG: hypothetical protein IKR86_04560 [Candidatus Methanomethylophilaceae archaeon]|nr:hypothetical protein [Candidatus Methanomethylophilaceae archaeon]
MKPWNEVARSVLPEGFDIMDWSFPVHNEESLARGRSLCAENKCGSYGRSWGCPPGCDLTVEKVSKEYSRMGVVKKRFEVDLSDKEALDRLGEDLQTHVRSIVLALRREGYRCLGFADGGCRYCGRCSYPEPCRYPEMLVPSVSVLGLDLKEYMAANGEDFRFEKDAVTMYGFIMMQRPDILY